MSSRRRPILRSSTVDEIPPTEGQLDTTFERHVAATLARHNREPSTTAQPGLARKPVPTLDRRSPAHPAATDYGPESFKNFLDGEGYSFKELSISCANLEKEHNQRLRGLLETLTNAQSQFGSLNNCRSVYSATSPTKPLRRPQPYTLLDSHESIRESAPHLPCQTRSTIHKRSVSGPEEVKSHQADTLRVRFERRKKSREINPQSHDARQSDTERDGDNDVLSTIMLDEPLALGSEDFGNCTSHIHRPAAPLSYRRPDQESFSSSLQEISSLPTSSLTSLSGCSSRSDRKLNSTNPNAIQLVGPAPRAQTKMQGDEVFMMHNRPRASSFENHATQSRHSLRSKTKTLDNDSHTAGASYRPRKMSASLHASLKPAVPPFIPRRQPMPVAKPVDQEVTLLPSRATRRGESPFILNNGLTKEDLTITEKEDVIKHRREAVSRILPDVKQEGQTNSLSVYSGTKSHSSRPAFDGAPRETEIATNIIQEQQAILESLSQGKTSNSPIKSQRSECITKFDYHTIIPEQLMKRMEHDEVLLDTAPRGDRINNRCALGIRSQLLKRASSLPMDVNHLSMKQPKGKGAHVISSKANPNEPPFCPPNAKPRTTLPNIIWEEGVLDYLSSAEVRGLRLVCKAFAEDLEPYVFRNVVTKFTPSMFNLNVNSDPTPILDLNASDSMLRKFGSEINKFGIAFEIDLKGLSTAPFKTTETTINAWFGRYRWPVKEYPYFSPLRQIDQILDDDRRFLTQALGKLTHCSELALSLDSGHGWLEGPDISDLALYREQPGTRSHVFGKTFSATDKSYEDGLKQLFRWAQINTIDENIQNLPASDRQTNDELARLRSILIRDYDSYRIQTQQPDYERHLHTGGAAIESTIHNGQQASVPNLIGNGPLPYADFLHSLITDQVDPQTIARRIEQYNRENRSPNASEKTPINSRLPPIQPQWPIIFNGFNIASECRGDSILMQNRIARPASFPLLPGQINEAQAQWMMETAWIQRTFLTAYTDAVRLNALTLKTVHSLTIAQISSGLLPSLSQEAFWTALPELRKIKILVKPDWRAEHTPGDKLYLSNMLIDPVKASMRFTEFLRNCISKLENLYTLHIGFVGGGEHQVGMFGRNQHILPAPVTQSPREWLLAFNGSTSVPNNNSILVFPHVRNLTFENCWFSPRMLEIFMTMSRDTSLHNLTLDSVSLTARVNSTRADGPLQTVKNNLKCTYGPGGWLSEEIPESASWVHVLDKITPGRTILDRKHIAQLIDEETPRPDPEFRGNIQSISLRSCGYVKIKGVSSSDFNQNELVVQNSSWTIMDDGLRTRASSGFSKAIFTDCPTDSNESRLLRAANRSGQSQTTSRSLRRRSLSWAFLPDNADASQDLQSQMSSIKFIMLGGRPGIYTNDTLSNFSEAAVHHTSLTGILTQCIHPVEKRILEQCWGMQFGWKDDMRRWEAVEDGWFIGGTGRFSGNVYRSEADQARAVAEAQRAMAAEITTTVHREHPDSTDTSDSMTAAVASSPDTTDTIDNVLTSSWDEDDGMNDENDGNDDEDVFSANDDTTGSLRPQYRHPPQDFLHHYQTNHMPTSTTTTTATATNDRPARTTRAANANSAIISRFFETPPFPDDDDDDDDDGDDDNDEELGGLLWETGKARDRA